MIQLDERHFIKVDSNNYTLIRDEQKEDKNGRHIYTPISYHGSLSEAIDGAKRYFIREALSTDKIETLGEATRKVKDVVDSLIAMMTWEE